MAAVELYVDATGDPEGPPVAFIHGFMSSNHQWDLNRARLGAKLRMLLIEQPGHGSSPASTEPDDYAPEAVIPALERVREQHGVERWWMVGHSMGGAVALRYALAHPERVLGVIFTNSKAAFGVGRADAADEQLPQLETRDDLRALPFHPIHAKRFPAELQARMVAKADSIPPIALTNVMRVASQWRSIGEPGSFSMPVLLVNGRWEKAFQPCVPDALAAIPHLHVVDLDGGHSVNIEAAREFDEAVLDFIG